MEQEQLQSGAGLALEEHLQMRVRLLTAFPVAKCLASNRRPKLEKLNTNKER